MQTNWSIHTAGCYSATRSNALTRHSKDEPRKRYTQQKQQTHRPRVLYGPTGVKCPEQAGPWRQQCVRNGRWGGEWRLPGLGTGVLRCQQQGGVAQRECTKCHRIVLSNGELYVTFTSIKIKPHKSAHVTATSHVLQNKSEPAIPLSSVSRCLQCSPTPRAVIKVPPPRATQAVRA